MRKKTVIDKEFLIKEYIENQKSASEIGRILGVKHDTVIKNLKYHDIPARSHKESRQVWYSKNDDPKIGVKHTIEHKIRIGAGLRRAYASGKRSWTEESRIKSRESNLGQKRSKICKEHQSQNHADFRGKNHPRWKGGLSYEPYCPKFNESAKEEIRCQHNRLCYLCGKSEKENGRKLDVHHIDYNKNSLCNGNIWALIPLCQKCHNQTTNKRWYYFNRLINYWVEKYVDFVGFCKN